VQLQQLVHNYGSETGRIYEVAGRDGALLQPVAGQETVLQAEVIHAIREEMALRLSDVLLRRTELGSGECPAEAVREASSRLMAAELGWEEARRQREIMEARALYQPA
jgi:glycerol-3-phosphate dehydrogenase